jgi:hypothetical protein
MTAGWSWALQRALFEALGADPLVVALVGDRLVDNPSDMIAAEGPAILIGEERVRPWGSANDRGADHDVTISIVAPDGGFGDLKRLASHVCAILDGPLPVEEGRIVLTSFLGSRAHRRGRAMERRVDLRFRVIIEARD